MTQADDDVDDANAVYPTVGGYKLLEVVGYGGMGTVHRARSPGGDIVALKVLSPHLVEKPIMRQRFLQEAELAMRLDHPNLVKAIDVGQDGDRLFFAMEYVDGESLGTTVERNGAMAQDTAVRIVTAVAHALHKAHKEGLVHRDVKPDNVLISRQGHIKLADLGLAKDLEGDLELTKVDRGLGTPVYMAPEQFRDAKYVDFRCDVYGLGELLYVMLTGKVPFTAKTSVDVFLKKREEDYVRPKELVKSLDDRIARTIEMSLAADPASRPSSAKQFVAMLIGKAPIPESGAAAGKNDGRRTPSFQNRPPSGGRPLPRPPKSRRSVFDSFDLIRVAMHRVDKTRACTAVQDEFGEAAMLWLEPGARWLLAGLAGAGAAALVVLILALKWMFSGPSTP